MALRDKGLVLRQLEEAFATNVPSTILGCETVKLVHHALVWCAKEVALCPKLMLPSMGDGS